MCGVIADLFLETRRLSFSKHAQNDCAAGQSFRLQSETFSKFEDILDMFETRHCAKILKHHSAGLHDDFHLSEGLGAVESFEGVSVQEDV